VVQAAEQQVSDPGELLRLVEASKIGDDLPIRVLRGDEQIDLAIRPEALPHS